VVQVAGKLWNYHVDHLREMKDTPLLHSMKLFKNSHGDREWACHTFRSKKRRLIKRE